MKHQSILFTIITGSVLFLFNPVKGQTPKEKIAFIKITDKIGFVIDSIENDQYKCVPYVSKKEYRYSALIQLADSSVILRIKLVNQAGFRNVHMGKTEVDNLHGYILSNKPKKTIDETIDEEKLMIEIAGDSFSYKLCRYDSLVYPVFRTQVSNEQNMADSQRNTFPYLQVGMGTGNFHGRGNLAYGIEFGIINKRSFFAVRCYSLKESKNTFSLFGSDKVDPKEFITDFGFLYGRVLDVGDAFFTFSAGISIIRGVNRGDFLYKTRTSNGWFSNYSSYYEKKVFQTIGIPLEANLFLGTFRHTKISFVVFGNINNVYSYGGLLLCLRFGELNHGYKSQGKNSINKQ